MKKYFQNLSSSDFSKNVLKLMSGSVLAQLIPLIAAPFLARTYSPEDFGKLALFLSLFQIFSIAINGKYEQAIILPKLTLDAIRLVIVCIVIDTIASGILLLTILLFRFEIITVLGLDVSFANWLITLPVVIWIFGLYNPLNYYAIRKEKYASIAKSKISKSMINNLFALGLGQSFASVGLLFGQLFGHLVAAISLLKLFFSEIKSEFKSLISSKDSIILLVKRYRNFPRYSIWGGLFNTLAFSSNNFYINKYFSTYELGMYSYSFKYISLPLNLIGESFKKVFLQASALELNETGQAKSIFLKTVRKMFIISVPIFTVTFFIIEDLFAFIFSEKWRVAGLYAKILIPMFMIRFIASPLSVVNQVFEKQVYALFINAFLLVVTLIVIFLSIYFNFSLQRFALTYSIVMGMSYLLVLLEEYLVVSNKI